MGKQREIIDTMAREAVEARVYDKVPGKRHDPDWQTPLEALILLVVITAAGAFGWAVAMLMEGV